MKKQQILSQRVTKRIIYNHCLDINYLDKLQAKQDFKKAWIQYNRFLTFDKSPTMVLTKTIFFLRTAKALV